MRQSVRWLWILVPAVVVLLASCSDEDVPLGPAHDQIAGIYVNHTDPADLIAAHAEATSARQVEAYEALLVPAADEVADFQFCPKPIDAGDMAWLEGDCWDIETEMAMMSHMFDSTFSLSEAVPVQSIDMDLDIVGTTESSPGTYVVDCLGLALVLVGPDQGFYTQTRFLIALVRVGDFLRIQRIEETNRRGSDPARSPGGPAWLSWATIKSYYR